MFSKRNAPSQIPYFREKKNSSKFIPIAYKYERVLKIFYFHILSNCQIWLNILMDDHHLSNITELKNTELYVYTVKILKISTFFNILFNSACILLLIDKMNHYDIGTHQFRPLWFLICWWKQKIELWNLLLHLHNELVEFSE
jgi:hypothetical protein